MALAKKYSSILIYFWDVIKHLFGLVLVLGSFSKAESGFESVALAGMVIIYLKLDMIGASQSQLGYNLARDMSLGFSRLESEEKYWATVEEVTDQNKIFDISLKRFYIKSVFGWIYFVLAILSLLR